MFLTFFDACHLLLVLITERMIEVQTYPHLLDAHGETGYCLIAYNHNEFKYNYGFFQ